MGIELKVEGNAVVMTCKDEHQAQRMHDHLAHIIVAEQRIADEVKPEGQ